MSISLILCLPQARHTCYRPPEETVIGSTAPVHDWVSLSDRAACLLLQFETRIQRLASRSFLCSLDYIFYAMDTFRLPHQLSNPKADDWRYFKRQLANYLLIVEAEEKQQLPILLNCLGRDGLDI